MRINSATLKPKIQHSKKLYKATFVDIRSLDYLFKQIDSEWDVMFNDAEVGFVYKISFRLMCSIIILFAERSPTRLLEKLSTINLSQIPLLKATSATGN